MILTLALLIQIILSLGLINVWIFRSRNETGYRGGSSTNLKGEFEAYGLPSWSFYLVGALKLSIAVALLGGIWLPELILPAAVTLCVLMVGALAMHIRVHDPLIRSLPATLMLAMAAALFVI
ncbi:MAG: putative membrane protein YphA (DoxX/SURF4 family) [Planctomycetota bacterium]|jgi:uncharacterized membrane protein YphA (DoxX/SURF4 family)